MLGEVGARVGVAGQFDDGQALVAGRGKGREDGWEVDLPVSEREVFVDAAAHVLDLDVPQPWRGGAYALGGREGFEALAVADVEGQAEVLGVAEDVTQAVEVGEGGQEVARLGLDGEGDAGGGGDVQDGGECLRQALPRRVGVRPCRCDPAEAVHGVGAEIGGDLDRADQEGDASGPVVRIRVQQRGAVFAARVEHIAGTRLDGDVQAERVQASGKPMGASGEVGRQRVEVHVVEGQPEAVVAEVGEKGEGVVETEVGEPVGAVAEAEGSDGAGASGSVLRLAVSRTPGLWAHVTLTFLPNLLPSGARAATSRAVVAAPERAVSAAWRGIVARMPPVTARWVSGGEGLRVAWK